jgi:RNA ligase
MNMIIDLQQLKEFAQANPQLVMQKASARYPDLFVVKYKNKVFYESLWTPELQEMRGLVVDKDWNVIVRPFSKIFNRFENGTDIPGDEEVIAVRKINGFLGCATLTEKYGLIISTTGSLDSEFAILAEKHLSKYANQLLVGWTYLFEIVDVSDPHIINEIPGAYLIGIRSHKLQNGLLSEGQLDNEAKNFSCLRPDWFRTRFDKIVEMTDRCRHEGFVVYGENTTLKIKSPYYLVKKLFSRVNPEKIDDQWLDTAKTWIDEEYYPLVEHIRANKDAFIQLTPQERRDFMEDFING